MRPRIESRPTAGFTVIEVLVAIALFAVVVLAVLAPLTGLFGLSQKSSQQATATTVAQSAVEQIRGQWLDRGRYGRNCYVGALPSGVTAAAQDENAQGGNIANVNSLTAGDAATCPTFALPLPATPSPAGPPLRKLTVTATKGASTSTLTVEVAQP